MKKELTQLRKRLKVLQLMCKRLRIIRDEYHKKYKPKITYIYDK
jgi:nicotinic acid mononucleotide adenylyltransferase